METFEVVMIGNTAVGKTSMLATLSTELDEYNLSLSGKIALEPTTTELKTITKQWIEMDEIIENQRPFTILTSALDATLLDFVEHKFDFKVDGSKEARVLFTDTRGGMTGDLDDKLIARINGAFGVFCVVDASVLMQCPDSKNERYNCPKFVKKLLNEVYSDGDDKQPRFVAFILTKCEKYMSTKKGQRELAKSFHDKYDTIVDMLNKAENAPNVYMLAIQTMCRVSFFKLNEEGWPEFRILPETATKTKDCAYPLVIVLQEIIEALDAAHKGTILDEAWDWLLKLLGLRKDFMKYLSEVEKAVEEPTLYEEL